MTVKDNSISAQTPYHNDFQHAVTENYHAILFKPAAIQARELTQLQYILQTQLSRVGDHLFKNGALVLGQVEYDFVYTVKVDTIGTYSDFIGRTVEGSNTVPANSTGAKYIVMGYEENINGSNYIFLKNIASG